MKVGPIFTFRKIFSPLYFRLKIPLFLLYYVLAFRNEAELQLVILPKPSIPFTYIERNVIQVPATLVFNLMDIKEADLFAISEFTYFYT